MKYNAIHAFRKKVDEPFKSHVQVGIAADPMILKRRL
jgi:hypothetical protein